MLNNSTKNSTKIIQSLMKKLGVGEYHDLDPVDSFLSNKENTEEQQKDESKEIDKDILAAKILILNRANFDVVIGKTKRNEFTNEVLKDNIENLNKFREKVISANDRDGLLEAIKELGENNSKIEQAFKKNPDSDNLGLTKSIEKRFDTFKNSLGGENQEKFLNDIIQLAKDEESARVKNGFSKIKNNSIDFLRHCGNPIQNNQHFEDLQAKVDGLCDKFSVPFFDFSNNQVGFALRVLDKFENNANDFCKRIGMTENCIGMDGKIAYGFEHHSFLYAGFSNASNRYIRLTESEGNAAILAHEWLHSLDGVVMDEAKEHLFKKYGLNAGIEEYVSESMGDFPLDGSKEFLAFNSFKKFISNAVSANPEELFKTQKQQEKKEVEAFYLEALGEKFFALKKETRDVLLSEDGVNLIKTKMTLPLSDDISKNVHSFMSKVLENQGLTQEDLSKVKDLAYSSDASIFSGALNRFRSINEHTVLGENKFVENSKRADAAIINNTGSWRGFDSGVHKMDENYFKKHTEYIARYIEAQLYPTQTVKKGEKFLPKENPFLIAKDLNFDERRRFLVSSCFGKSAVKEMDLPRINKLDDLKLSAEVLVKRELVVRPKAIFGDIISSVRGVYNQRNKGVEMSKNENISPLLENNKEQEISLSINKEVLSESKIKKILENKNERSLGLKN